MLIHGLLWLIRDLASHPWWTVGLLGIGFLSLSVVASRWEDRLTLGRLMAVAVLLRILLLPLPPTLSDDTLRYAWDGKVISAGFNPYLLAPDNPTLTELRDRRWQIMPHKEVPTVYPPLALAVFAAGNLFPDPELGIKILLVFIDLLACYLLFALARRLAIPIGRVAWYAWNPLVILEVAGQGHVDVIIVAAAVGTVLAVTKGKMAAAGLAAAAGVAGKLVPVVIIPLWAAVIFRSSSSVRNALIFLSAAGAGLAVTFAPVWTTTGVPPGLITYGVSWEFNGPIYEPLWRAIDRIDPIDEIKSGIDRLKNTFAEQTGYEFWNRFYHFVYPQFLAKLLLAGGFAVGWLALLWRARDPVTDTGRAFGLVILAMATVYPWYLLWIVPWAALKKHPAGLAVAALALLSYVPQHHPDITLFPWIWACIWLPPLIYLALQAFRSGESRS